MTLLLYQLTSIDFENQHMKIKYCLIPIYLLLAVVALNAQQHPIISWTPKDVNDLNIEAGTAPLFEKVLLENQQLVDAEIKSGIDVPIPKDMAGGYTHERHKRNFFMLQKAGDLYLITKEEKYAKYIQEMLLQYAEVYPKVDRHPAEKSYARGKFFWQALNDANWLVYVSQAYDAVYNWMDPKQRDYLEKELFRPYADFISLENPRFFNRVHNHSTWGNAAVGMIGLVMGDEELINRALYGIKDVNIEAGAKDNDGGLIQLKGQKEAGFFAQLDNAFSPDGYYTEGPYYQRYALSPFILFARALANTRPDLKIFEYRDNLLKKAVYALLYQTDAQGQFFPINDSQKGMSIESRELIAAVDILYKYGGADAELLSIAAQQNSVQLDDTGFKVAKHLAEGKGLPFKRPSVELRDGKEGTDGALGVLRSKKKDHELTVAFKYTSHGLSHGHFDKLSYSLYDPFGEVIQDYGAARWVNIDQKAGGRYLPENKTWAKQTIAHNTVTINEQSHFNGDIQISQNYHSTPYFMDVSNPDIQIASAKEKVAYEGVEMHRTLLLLKDPLFEKPLFVDLFRVNSPKNVQMDLPIWFKGHILETDFDYDVQLEQQQLLGEKHGYQHVWKQAQGTSKDPSITFSWFNTGHFYTTTMAVASSDQLIIGQLGANDPNFNLRPDQCLIVRKPDAKETLFATVLESHGSYSPVDEIPLQPYGQVENIKILLDNNNYSAINWQVASGESFTLIVSNQDADSNKKHQLIIGTTSYEWSGPYHLSKK